MPERVFNVGSLCGDVLNGMSLLSRLELEKDLKMTLDDFILITYHPCTLGGTSSLEVLKNILSALDAYPKLNLVFTKANADTEGSRINTYLEAWCQQHERSVLKSNLGSLRYLSALKHCRCVVGNSSSGILEAPFFKTPTLNVGDRQKGRIKAKNVITVKEDLNAVQCGLQKALSSSFCDEIALMENPYEKGSCARSILKIISNEGFPLKVKKSFKDIN
jgi:UDP-hydrolysing UDP-N-acetyl-D-glucosamine 2-epimerase